MTETTTLINSDRTAELERESDSALFHRRIEFHVARRPFTGFGNNSSNGFKLVTLNRASEPPVASVLGKKSEKSSEFFDTGIDPELTFEISFRRIGAGLRNLGNTCFLNSVLQCLTYTEPLAAYLQSGKHQNSCHRAGFCALCAIQKHVSRALQSTGRILEPKDLVSNLRRISRNFGNYRQEDAHEYMVYLLESMHKCCLPSGVPSESPSAYEKSLVHKIFGGRLRSQVKCMQCSYCSNKFDPFLDLSLEIVKADSLHKALAHFTTKEQLDGGAKEYQCQQCKQKVRALKQLTIYKAPLVLTVHLKRFRAYDPGQKIDKKVAFEPTMDLKPFVSGPYNGELNYTLYGVLVHAGGSTRCGHYYCFVRTSSGMWYSLDDNQVVQVNERTVLSQKAYMLFYVRDRKKFCAKKPVDAVQKRNMAMNGMGNAAFPKLNPEMKDKIQNGSNEKKLNGFSSAALSASDAVIAALPEETPPGDKSSPNTNGTMAVDNLGHKKDSKSEHSSVVPPTNNLLEVHSVMDVHSVGHKGEPHSMIVVSGDSLSIGHVKNITCNNRSVVEEQNTCDVILADSEMPQDPLHMKESSDLIPRPSVCNDNDKENSSELAKKIPNSPVLDTSSGDTSKMKDSNFDMCLSKIMPVEANPKPSNEDNHISKQNNIEESQAEGSFVKTAVPTIEETCDNDEKLDNVQSKELSGLPEPLLHGVTKKRRPSLKVRRKLFKCQVGTTSISSNIILGVGPCMRKKKHKRRKRNSVQKSSNVKHLLDGNVSPSKLGQSTTEEPFPVLTDNCTRSQKKKIQGGLNGQDQASSIKNEDKDGISVDVTYKEFRARVGHDGTTVSAEKPTEIKHSAAQVSVNSEEELRQTDIMSILTRGLDERIVARWDDGSLSQISETRPAGTAQIGYIGDEWDEDYDRGKRKKVRGPKISFDGPNLFQEIATQNSNRKRAKLDRSRFENQPFRI